jgi:hypothetical protein
MLLSCTKCHYNSNSSLSKLAGWLLAEAEDVVAGERLSPRYP